MTRLDRVVVVSDMHLGIPACNRFAIQQFVEWLAADPPGRLVLLGDIVDLWRRSNGKVLTENREVLAKLFSVDCQIDYVPGNHDFEIWDVADRTGKDVLWPGDFTISKDLRITMDGHTYYMTHGYDLDVAVTMEGMPIRTYEAFAAAMCRADDTLGGLASLLWDAVAISGSGISWIRQMGRPKPDMEYRDIYDVAMSGAAHLLLGAHPKDRLIYGHTHWPCINKAGNVANTGSWCTEAGVRVHNTYLEITPKGMSLKTFPGWPFV